jgi:hypothetical protein
VSAHAGATAASLNGITCRTTSNCTSVGDAQIGSQLSPLSESWNGNTWTIEPLTRPKAHGAALAAVSCPSNGECIAVGDQQLSAGSKPSVLIERWSS